MNTAPIATATPSDKSGLPPPVPPSAPGTPSFSDMLASATSSLAAFALLPTSANEALSSARSSAPAPKKDPNNDNAAVPIAVPTPVQTPPATPASPANASSGSSQTAPAAATTPPTQAGEAPATTAPSGSAATGGTSNGSAQTTNGVALPSMASELGTKVALGAQALLSQPIQVLATLPHSALATAPTLAPGLAASAHGATAPDPTAVLPKLAASAAVAAATPNGTPTTLETALQSATVQAPASSGATSAASEAAVLANTADTTTHTSPDPGLGTVPPAAIPLPNAEAAPNIESAPPPAIAASALDQVAASLKQGGKLGLSQIELQLKPAALGTVDVKLELTHDGRVAAVISADRSDTLMQLQRGSGELQQALRDAGLQTDSGSLSFNLRGDAQTSDQSGRQSSYATPQPALSIGSSDDLLAVPVAIAGGTPPSHNGLLNIQV